MGKPVCSRFKRWTTHANTIHQEPHQYSHTLQRLVYMCGSSNSTIRNVKKSLNAMKSRWLNVSLLGVMKIVPSFRLTSFTFGFKDESGKKQKKRSVACDVSIYDKQHSRNHHVISICSPCQCSSFRLLATYRIARCHKAITFRSHHYYYRALGVFCCVRRISCILHGACE